MKASKKWTLVITLLCACSLGALDSEAGNQPPEGRRGHHGPPPEAYAACEGQEAGDRAEFVSPRGDTVTGTCVLQGDRLVLRPDNPPQGKQFQGAKSDED